MTTVSKPDNEYYRDGYTPTVFNIGYFKSASTYVTLAYINQYFAKLTSSNNFTALNNFIQIQISDTINGISASFLEYLQYIPNLIEDLTNVTYNEATNSTIVTDNTVLDKLQVSNNVQVNNSVISPFINTYSVNTEILNTKQLLIGSSTYQPYIAFLSINGLTFPIKNSIMLTKLNMSPTSTTQAYITIDAFYSFEFVDNEGVPLFRYANLTGEMVFNIPLVLNQNMIKLNIYDINNNLI